MKMLQTGSQEVLDFPARDAFSRGPRRLPVRVRAEGEKPAGQLRPGDAAEGRAPDLLSFLQSLSQFQGRLRFPTRIFRLLLSSRTSVPETEALVGDFLKKIVGEVKDALPTC